MEQDLDLVVRATSQIQEHLWMAQAWDIIKVTHRVQGLLPQGAATQEEAFLR